MRVDRVPKPWNEQEDARYMLGVSFFVYAATWRVQCIRGLRIRFGICWSSRQCERGPATVAAHGRTVLPRGSAWTGSRCCKRAMDQELIDSDL